MASITKYGADGWRCRVKKAGHQTITKTFAKKVDAQTWARQQLNKLDKGQSFDVEVAGRGVTVRELFQKHVDNVIPPKPEKAGGEDPYKGSRNTLLRLIRNAEFMNRRINQIRPIDIANWRDARLLEIKPDSVNREFTAISGVFSHAIKNHQITIQNPARDAGRPKAPDTRREVRWTDKDIQKLLKAAEFNPDEKPAKTMDYVGWALLVALETAMRAGEICKLKVSDFHPDRREVFLAKTKNGDPRKVPLSKKAMEYFELLTADRDQDEKIFPPYGSLGVYFRDARKVAKLSSDLRFHDMRHEAATRLSNKLVNVLELSAMTGHRSLKSLKRYYNPTSEEIAAKLDA